MYRFVPASPSPFKCYNPFGRYRGCGDIRMKTFKILVCLAALAWDGPSLLDAAPIPTAPVYTNKLKFRIPFHYDSAEISRLGARQIQLYVSRDRGRAWQPYQSVAPDAGKFKIGRASCRERG